MNVWQALAMFQMYVSERGISAWWAIQTHAFKEQWIHGSGLFLFVLEPLLLIFGTYIAQCCCRLKPKTIWSVPALTLGAYMIFWLQPLLSWLATGDEWTPDVGYFTTMPLLVGGGTILLVKHGFRTGWKSAACFAFLMLATNYIICIAVSYFLPR